MHQYYNKAKSDVDQNPLANLFGKIQIGTKLDPPTNWNLIH